MRNYDKEYRDYQGTPEQIRRRARRNAARRLMIKKFGKKRLRGKDIDHIDSNPMNNKYSNLRITSRRFNRSRQ
jgi:hypothetical protein